MIKIVAMNSHPNKPCYCGSGKKYKKCHKIIDHAHEQALADNRRIDYDKYSKMLDHGEGVYAIKQHYINKYGEFDKGDFMTTYEYSDHDMECLAHYEKYVDSKADIELIKSIYNMTIGGDLNVYE